MKKHEWIIGLRRGCRLKKVSQDNSAYGTYCRKNGGSCTFEHCPKVNEKTFHCEDCGKETPESQKREVAYQPNTRNRKGLRVKTYCPECSEKRCPSVAVGPLAVKGVE